MMTLKRFIRPPRVSLFECVLAFLGSFAIGMATMFIYLWLAP